MWRVLRPDAPGPGQEAGLLEKVDAVDSLALHGYAKIGELAGRGGPADIDGVDADGVDLDLELSDEVLDSGDRPLAHDLDGIRAGRTGGAAKVQREGPFVNEAQVAPVADAAGHADDSALGRGRRAAVGIRGIQVLASFFSSDPEGSVAARKMS